jgi:hypothetical protein
MQFGHKVDRPAMRFGHKANDSAKRFGHKVNKVKKGKKQTTPEQKDLTHSYLEKY